MSALPYVLALFVAQSPLTEPAAPVDTPEPKPKKKHLPDYEPDCRGSEMFGGTDLERGAYCAAQRREYVTTRTLANEVLNRDADSIRGNYLMGLAQHLGEGNLPKALFHLNHAEQVFIDRFGERPAMEGTLWRVFHRTMSELIYVHGEMDHHEQKIAYVDKLNRRLEIDYEPLKAWPLLKLGRYEEAKQIAERATNHEEPWYRAVGMTALCAVESEQRKRDAAYEACTGAAQRVMRSGRDGAIELSNAGAASEEMFRFDEAERYFLESARRPPEGSVNPWGRLVRLYLRQGRFAEAVSSWREMRRYRASRPGSYLDQQDQSEADLIGASVLLIAGKPTEAERITARTVNRPDRQGTSSAATEQNEGGAAITDRVAKLTAARRLEEEAAASEWKEAIGLRVDALMLRFRAWVVTRTAAEVLADRERLVTSLRPEVPGSLEMPAWLDAEVIEIVGPGVARAALKEARAEETLDAKYADQIFLSLETEAAFLAGDEEEALTLAKEALDVLPPSEALLRARVAAVAQAAAREEQRFEDALGYLRVVLSSDPQIIRRMGMTLPVRIEPAGDTPGVDAAIDRLEDSPLFDEAPWGFVLRVGETRVDLVAPDGSTLAMVPIPAGRSDTPDAIGRRIAREVQRELLVPNVDITQADIRSLDGSLGTGGKATDRVDEILE
ncbi:MAG: hypothetical protein RMA76_40975 [Deltaproteobacteria bacterium]|jgi:tetratricopeptide (TPR) repeat protein